MTSKLSLIQKITLGLIHRMPKVFREKAVIYFNNCDNPNYLSWYSRYSRRLLKYKDIHKGEGCFIIGNGPSLNRMDLAPLMNYHSFGLNKIHLMLEKVDLNMSYHVAINPLVIEQSAKEIESLPCPSFISYNHACKVIRPLSHIHFIYLGAPLLFQSDLTQKMFSSHTVTYTAMEIAYYMGFSTVFLIGVDHSFSASGKGGDKQLLKEDDLDHFDPNYFKNQEWQLPNLEGSELCYRIAKYFFNRNGRDIYDATVDGKLQVFPKISYKEALKMCSKKQS